MSTTPNCPCDACSFPETISNVPGLSTVQYRVGDFTSFRNALLQSQPGEVELANWKPTSDSDLALQMIEWWAYLADVLTFYNQRIANQNYLRTADLDASVRNLVSVLGYRPRPGIGATATLAALVSASQPITLPQGLAVQSKPGPGSPPQTFELLQKTVAQPGGSVSADPDNSKVPFGGDGSVLLQGTVSSIKTGDLLLLVANDWSGSDLNYLLGNVLSVQQQVSPRGAKYTQVFLSNVGLPVPTGATYTAGSYRLLRSTQTARLFQYGTTIGTSLTNGETGYAIADLDSVARLIQPGDIVLFDSLNGKTPEAFVGVSAVISTNDATAQYTEDSNDAASYGLGSGLYPVTEKAAAPHAAKRAAVAKPDAKIEARDVHTGANDPDSSNNLIGNTGVLEDTQNQSGSGSASNGVGTAPNGMYLAFVSDYTEVVWYANLPAPPAAATTATGESAPAQTVSAIPVLHSEITFTPVVSAPSATSLVIRYGWQDVGVLIPPPATSFDGTTYLVAVVPPSFPAWSTVTALLQDQNGAGVLVNGSLASVSAGPLPVTELQLSDTVSGTALRPLSPKLTPPIQVLTNLLPFTCGKTVPSEVLGSGDATQAGQVFALAKSPLTYLLSAASTSGDNYTSTLLVQVNGVQWQEQPSFYGQLPNATIFVTREDDNAVTYVQFGDGVNGARLPSGTNNVTANYRYGSGAAAPAAGTLTIVNTSQPGLASIQNPVAAGGGTDPQPSSQMRQLAPLSALALGRAISGDDYEAIAASTPGVTRASAVWSFDTASQRTGVTVYVGDDAAAQSAAQLALSGDADPNRPLSVVQAAPIPLTVTMTLSVNPDYGLSAVAALAVTALTDPDAGLFGANKIGIGQAVYRSQIYAVCLAVPGAVAVLNLVVTGVDQNGPSYRYDPGPGKFFTVSPTYTTLPPAGPVGLQITPEVANG